MAVLKYDAVAVIGKKKDGTPVRMKVGSVWETDKGISLKLDAVPVGAEFSGWVNFYEPKPKDKAPASVHSKNLPTEGSFEDDPIPF